MICGGEIEIQWRQHVLFSMLLCNHFSDVYGFIGSLWEYNSIYFKHSFIMFLWGEIIWQYDEHTLHEKKCNMIVGHFGIMIWMQWS